MAEEKPNTNITSQAMLSDDDISALEHVLQYIKGASPSSITPLEMEMLSDDQFGRTETARSRRGVVFVV